MTYKIRYRKTTVEVSGNKPTQCECCLSFPKKPNTHHWIYEFSKKEILENPELAKKNTSILCYPCHLAANAIRISLEDQKRLRVLNRLRARALWSGSS